MNIRIKYNETIGQTQAYVTYNTSKDIKATEIIPGLF